MTMIYEVWRNFTLQKIETVCVFASSLLRHLLDISYLLNNVSLLRTNIICFVITIV